MLRRLLIITLVVITSLTQLSAKSRQTRKEYIDRYKHIAVKHMEYYGIPASITMAQGILESDSGNSSLSTNSNNHFGIKCKSNWKGRRVYHDDDEAGECFRAYPSVEASYEDHADFLDSSPRYDSLFAYSSADYKSWARGLKAAGYATAPHYATMLVKIIEDEKLYILDEENGEVKYTTLAYNSEHPSAQVEETIVDPDNYSVTINAHQGYNIERVNGLFFTRAKKGDTIESLAEAFDLWRWSLRRFNDLKRDAVIMEGDIIFIERKRAHWEGDQKRTHQVEAGESLYSVSQRYGVRLGRLCRYNNLKRDDSIKVSQILIIR